MGFLVTVQPIQVEKCKLMLTYDCMYMDTNKLKKGKRDEMILFKIIM